MTPVQVFEADSGDLVITFLGIMGSGGLLIWRGEKGWEFHEAESVTWQAEICSAVWRAAVFPPVLARLDSRSHDPIEEQVWVVTRRHDVQTPLGAIRQAVVEAAFWSEGQAQGLAQQTPPERDCYPVRICAHQSEERLVAYLPSWVEGLSLHNVVALLALA